MSPSTTRRRLLRTATGLALGSAVAGCNQQPADTQSTTTTQTTPTSPDADSRPRVDVSRESYLAKAWPITSDRFHVADGDAVQLSRLSKPARDAVQTAIEDGRYSTQNASADLLDGIEDVDFVVHDGTIYDVTHTFPTVTLRLDMDIADDAAPEDATVSLDSDFVRSNDTVSDVIYTIAPYGTHGVAESYTTARVDPAVQDFLDRFDYVRSPHGVGEIVVSRTNRTPPHTIRAEPATDEERYGRRVRDVTDYGPPTRTLVERVLASDRKTPGNHQERIHTVYPDDVPRRFSRDLDHGSHYVRVDDTVYGFDTRHVHWPDLPVRFHATVPDDETTADATSDTVAVQLSVDNPSDVRVVLQMAGVAPFGVLWAYGPGSEHVLWNDAYEQTDAVVIEDGTVVPESHDERELPPGQAESATYRLGHDTLGDKGSLQSGTYDVLGTIWAKWPTYERAERYDWRSQLFPYTLTIEVP